MIYIKFNLKKYKNNGKFQAIVNPNDSMWQTKDGQDYLKAFYSLDEAYKMGLVTDDEREMLRCELVHPNKPCPYSTYYHFREPSFYEDGEGVASALGC